MSAPKEKAAGMFVASEAAQEIKQAQSTPEKQFSTTQAQFALKGHRLEKDTRDGKTIYTVSRWGQSRVFSHLHDVQGFLAQIGGAYGL